MHVVQHAAGYANREYAELADGFVFHAARHVDYDSLVEFDFLIVEEHRSLAVDHVVDFVGLFVVVKLGVVDFDIQDFRRGFVLFFDQAANDAARFSPRCNFRWIATQKACLSVHVEVPPWCQKLFLLSFIVTNLTEENEHDDGKEKQQSKCGLDS